MSEDPFAAASDSLIAPARHAFAITPQDDVALSAATKALYIGTPGDIALRAVGSSDFVLIRNVPSGTVLAIRVAAVSAAGTTAADIVGLA
jgi:hypothetical protein